MSKNKLDRFCDKCGSNKTIERKIGDVFRWECEHCKYQTQWRKSKTELLQDWKKKETKDDTRMERQPSPNV